MPFESRVSNKSAEDILHIKEKFGNLLENFYFSLSVAPFLSNFIKIKKYIKRVFRLSRLTLRRQYPNRI